MSQTAAQRRTLEILDQGKPGDWASLISDWFFITLVLANITAVVDDVIFVAVDRHDGPTVAAAARQGTASLLYLP